MGMDITIKIGAVRVKAVDDRQSEPLTLRTVVLLIYTTQNRKSMMASIGKMNRNGDKNSLRNGLLNRNLIKSQILIILKEKNSLRQNELARYIGISPNSLKKIANELVSSNLIKKDKIKGFVNYAILNSSSSSGN